jgi:hypothetical protein
MSASLHHQADGLRNLARILNARHLMRSGAVSRQSEADHLILMLKDAAETLERLSNGNEF